MALSCLGARALRPAGARFGDAPAARDVKAGTPGPPPRVEPTGNVRDHMEQPRRVGDAKTVSQLKDDIDSGLTGDKNATADPGLSPLGTDDEAAGRPASPERVALAREEEKKIGRLATAADKPKTHAPIMVLIAAIVVIAGVIVLAFYLAR
jgi:hypothetical protein